MSMGRVLITGASRGIGRATALRLSASGWQIAGHFASNRAAASEVELLIPGSRWYQADLRDPSSATELWQAVCADGSVDALVNNAGIYSKLDFCNASQEEFERIQRETFQVNFDSPALLIRLASQDWIRRGVSGRVVNVASRVGHRGEAGAAFYSASKSALINLTRALAVEHANLGIRHFAIAPGWVETSMAREGMEERLPQILKDIPLGRMASPEDCAAAIEFLLSPGADYLSGIVIDINGASYLR